MDYLTLCEGLGLGLGLEKKSYLHLCFTVVFLPFVGRVCGLTQDAGATGGGRSGHEGAGVRPAAGGRPGGRGRDGQVHGEGQRQPATEGHVVAQRHHRRQREQPRVMMNIYDVTWMNIYDVCGRRVRRLTGARSGQVSLSDSGIRQLISGIRQFNPFYPY